MVFDFKKILPHLAAFVIFIVASLAYFNPVLSGKKLFQNDIVQYKGNARQLIEHRADTGEELYWTDTLFGGMPTYQLGARYEYDFIDQLDRLIRFLPRPADYLFLYLISFYIMLMVMRVPWKYAMLGALAFGFSTYLIIILGVGHNSKAHAVAYFPILISGVILNFRKKYWLGFLIVAVGMALELQANHLQMTYYLMFAVIIIGITYLIDYYKQNELPHFFKSVGVMVGAVLLALGTNAANLMATSQFSSTTTRGRSAISINEKGEEISQLPGLEFDYITQYSYGFTESWNMLIPRFTGGGSGDRPGEDSATVDFMMSLGMSKPEAFDFASGSVPMYWGDQPIVEAPAYLGVGVVFLAILALFLIKGRLKWWSIGIISFSYLLALGRNLDFVTRFFVDYIPLYDKFRAVTSILVLMEFCVPLLAAVGLYYFISEKSNREKKIKALKYTGGVLGALFLLFGLLGNVLFDFSAPSDIYYTEIKELGSAFISAVREDRWHLMRDDSLRSLLIVGVIVGLLLLYLKKAFNHNIVVFCLGLVVLIDLISFNLEYVNSDQFVTAREYDNFLPKYPADTRIQNEEGHFRVYDLTVDPNTSARASAFHKAFGGYHPAKPGRFQDILDFYMNDEQGRTAGISQNNIEIISMFNTKYILEPIEGDVIAKENPLAMGNAWFVNEVITVADQNEEILSLKNLKGDVLAIITEEEKDKINLGKVGKDSTAQIELISYDPERLEYKSENDKDGLAVFSEMYYPHGWKATLDGQEIPIAKVNYTLRGLNIPAGEHKIIFTFEPQVIKTGSIIMLGSNILLALLLITGIYFVIKKRG
ncbi:MAG: YfhO family protein [Nonlabens sp.]